MLKLALALLFLSSFNAQAEDCLKFVFYSNLDIAKKLNQNIISALATEGICATVDYKPSKRATAMFLRGEYDGEIGRTDDYEKVIGHMAIKVPVPLISYYGQIITRNKHIQSVDDFRKLREPIGMIQGWSWMEEATKEHRLNNEYIVTSIPALLKAFETKRVSSIFYTETLAQFFPKIAKFDFKYKSFNVIKLQIYVWMNKRHQDKVKLVEKALSQQIKKGKLIPTLKNK